MCDVQIIIGEMQAILTRAEEGALPPCVMSRSLRENGDCAMGARSKTAVTSMRIATVRSTIVHSDGEVEAAVLRRVVEQQAVRMNEALCAMGRRSLCTRQDGPAYGRGPG